jgi:hypothetical protein
MFNSKLIHLEMKYFLLVYTTFAGKGIYDVDKISGADNLKL